MPTLIRFQVPIQLFFLLIITPNVQGFMSFFTSPASPPSLVHHNKYDSHHYPNLNLRLEPVHIVKSMHSNCPDSKNNNNNNNHLHQGHNSDTKAYINPFPAMIESMSVADDTKILMRGVQTELRNGLRGVTPPPGSSKRIHSKLDNNNNNNNNNNEELRSVNPPSFDSNPIHKKDNHEEQVKYRSTIPPPGSSSSIHSQGLAIGGLRN